MVEKIKSPKKERSSNTLGSRTPNVNSGDCAHAMKTFMKILRNKHAADDERVSAASELGYIGQESQDAVPVIVSHLISVLTDESASLRTAATKALGSMGPKSKDAVSALNSALRDEDASVREWAAFALGMIGPDSQDDIPALIAAAAMDESASVRSRAHTALGMLREIIVPHLIPFLTHEDAAVRSYAAFALGKAGRRSKDAVSTLVSTVLTDEYLSVRYRAACALGYIGQSAKGKKDEATRLKVQDAIPALQKILRHKNDDMRKSAAWALGNVIGPEVRNIRRVVQALIKSFSDKDTHVRALAAEAVCNAEKSAISALTKASHSKSSIVRACAKDALERIEQ